ncbi:hypothetical protein BpJC4_31000 [Weizmannia acidilactici]|uniref:phage minor capsid protein n=1 Tax=Weizmannia acidilactici TaxID=2607726 RepID=UPI0012800EEF|nr:phage minor capsid protein [Weizmannia acidilactici]GER68629.1 hypothetical protein BpJC4_31000 [Weizmannia acidilactici]
MDPLKQQQISVPTIEVYLAIEEQIFLNVAKCLKKNQSLLTPENIHTWQAQQLGLLGALIQANIITIAKNSGKAIDEISKALKEAGYLAAGEFENDLQEAVRQGKLVEPPGALENSKSLENILSAFQAQAKQTFNMVNTTMLQQSQQAYINILSTTVGKTLTGAQTPFQTMSDAAKQWAEKGIPALVDKAGRQWSTEAYMNMVVRTLVGNVANEMQLGRAQEYGVDLVEVSSHMGSRPSHEPFQGHIFSISGKSNKFPPLSKTGYGTPGGLLGINCRHEIFPYIDGVSKKTYHLVDHEKNKQAYIESQKQRALERRIRAAKREQMMMEEIGDKEGALKAKQKVREQQADMRAFINDTGRTRRYDREQIGLMTKRNAEETYQQLTSKKRD